ncbi:MAG TPA: YggS family pyridoxal phosphate-dependent enzyme [Acidimicrobiales bacterium]|nr:YggS family pyridoxal phosphate-dependent enzyme [Acidimicrobiales bacterium]
MALTAELVAHRLADVEERIRGAGATPGSVRVVAVTKGHGVAAVDAALAAGLVDLGENYAGELLAKQSAIASGAIGQEGMVPKWHFLGHVQRNKVRGLAPVVYLWQGIDRVTVGEEIARRAPGAHVLVQVNVSGEVAKNGCTFEDAPELVSGLTDVGLTVAGLMAVGPARDADPRPCYRRLSSLADRLRLTERSMGMSADLEIAVEEGSTMVRIGQALFGARVARTGDADLRR